MAHLMRCTNGHLCRSSTGHLRLKVPGTWHKHYNWDNQHFAGYANIVYDGDWGTSNCGYNEDPNDFLSQAKAQAEANISKIPYWTDAKIRGWVGYHGYHEWPLGWPSRMEVSAQCYCEWKKYKCESSSAISIKATTTMYTSVNARFGVFNSEPTIAQMKSATGTSAAVILFNKDQVDLYNNNDYIWVSCYLPVPTGLSIPIAQNTNADSWDPDKDPPQYYLGTQFDEVRHWKNSGVPDTKIEENRLDPNLQVFY